jgi:hypothetical protein
MLALSDHIPFFASNNRISLFSWNILTQMKFNETYKYFNNGFSCANETDEQYKNRLLLIANQICHEHRNKNFKFICLQECPREEVLSNLFLTKIIDELINYKAERFSNIEANYHLITIYDISLYQVEQVLTEKLLETKLNQGLESRILPLVFRHKPSGIKSCIVNVHANFGREIKDDILALYGKAKKLDIEEVTFLGDFNRDLTSTTDDSLHDIAIALDSDYRLNNSLYVKSLYQSYLTYDLEKRNISYETRDGVISNFESLELVSVADINSINQGTEELSPDLKLPNQDYRSSCKIAY